MKLNDIQPIDWLEKHANNKDIAQEYLQDCLLAEVYSPEVLHTARHNWKDLPFYVTESLDPEMIALIQNPVSDIQAAINRYWIQRAINVLNAYGNCPIPLSGDKRIVGPRRNLLSDKGRKQLHILEKALKENHFTNKLAAIARSGAQKANLDLSLFINFDYLAPLAVNDCSPISSDFKDVQVPLSMGCYNGCVHCGYDAKMPVSHIPYPVFLQIFNVLHKANKKCELWYLYNDSDPVTYYDPIINADTGDVIRALLPVQKNDTFIEETLPFLTKGVTTRREEITFAKVMYHHVLSPSDTYIPVSMLLSLIDLPGENVKQNLKRIQRTQELALSVRDIAPNIMHRHLPKERRLKPHHLSSLQNVSEETVFDVVGRMAKTVEQLNKERLFGSVYLEETSRRITSNEYVIGPDLVLYDFYREGNRIARQPLCSVLDRAFIARLINPVRRHPTLAAPKTITTDKKPSRITRLFNALLGGRTPNS